MFRSADPHRPTPVPARRAEAIATDDSGAAAIEFSLVMGLIIATLAATLQLGGALMARNEMSHALSRASRMIIVDGSQTMAQVSASITDRLSEYDPTLLTVSAAESTVAGTKFVAVSVVYPYETSIPFQSLATLNLTAETMVPIVSSTK